MFPTNRLLSLGLLSLLALPALRAQALTSWDVGASLVLPLDGLKKVTQASGLGGFTAEAGYHGLVHGSALPFRLSASVLALPGKQVAYVKSSLLGFQVAADVFSPTGVDRLLLVTGLSVNQWRWDYQDATQHTKASLKGAKLGARFGFDYQLNPRVTARLLLQVTELGTDNQRIRSYNPSWVQAGAKYRF